MGDVSLNGYVFGNITGVLPLSSAAGLASATVNCRIPTSGKRTRVYYLSYAPQTSVECYFTFGETQVKILYNKPPAGGIVAKDFGEARYIQGGIDEILILSITPSADVYWNVLYVEVD